MPPPSSSALGTLEPRLSVRLARSPSFAERARRVLEAETVLILARDAAGEPVRAAAGGPVVLDVATAQLMEEGERQLDELGRESTPIVEQVCGRSGRWRSVGMYSGAARSGVLHVRCNAGWELSEHRRQMLLVLARAATLTDLREGAASSLTREERSAALQLTELALSVETYAELVGGISAVIAPLLDAAKAGLAIWHRERGYLELLPGSFSGADDVVGSSRVRTSELRSQAGRVVSNGRAEFTNRAQADVPLYRGHFVAMGVTQLLTMPIVAPGRLLGVLHIANKRTRFNASDVDRLEPVMPFVAALVEHVRDRLEMREREELAAVVAGAATAIAAGQAPARLSGLFDEFCLAIRARMLRVTFSDGSAPIVVRDGEVAGEVERLFVTHSERGVAVAQKNTMAESSGAGDAGWAALHTPVLIGGEPKATLSLLRMPYEPFVEHERAAVRRLANVTALAWATERYQRERAQMVRLRERQRIADDLHDHVAQIMFSGQLTLESVLERLDRDAPVVPDLARARDILIHSQNSIREVIEQLSRSERMTLTARLVEIAHIVEDEFHAVIHVDVAKRRIELAESASAALTDAALSAAREGMVNAAKHAGTGQIWVTVRVNARGRLILTVDDGGPGMPSAPRPGHGLSSIRRRVRRHEGLLRIGRSERGGARLMVSMPLPAARSRRGDGAAAASRRGVT